MNRTLLSLLGVVFACLAVAACGSSSSSSSAGAASAGSATRTKLVACLKAHGVTLPNRAGAGRRFGPGGAAGRPPGALGAGPGAFGGGPAAGGHRFGANPKFQAAFRACGAGFRRRGFTTAQRRAGVQRFVTCVRQHGYDLPQPNFSGHGSIFPAKIATNPKFRAASRSCLASLRPAGGGANGPGAPPPSA